MGTLNLRRIIYEKGYTQGMLSVVDGFDGSKFTCFTLEDQVRPKGVKVYGETAIPAGMYEVIINMSNRFKRRLPLFLKVEGFEGIRIHTGNKAEDSHGCILVGSSYAGGGVIQKSKAAFDALFDLMDKELKKEKVFFNVEDTKSV